MSARVEEREFRFKGRRLAARAWHDPSLPPLLLLHGWQDNAANEHLSRFLRVAE